LRDQEPSKPSALREALKQALTAERVWQALQTAKAA
jgi:hypothetical protein